MTPRHRGHHRRLSALIPALVLLGHLGICLTASGAGEDARPKIRKLGTLDWGMVETTPVVFKGRLYRFEYVRQDYHANKAKASAFRFIDVATGKPTPVFARGYHLGCAHVEGDTVYAYGVDRWGGAKVAVFRSK